MKKESRELLLTVGYLQRKYSLYVKKVAMLIENGAKVNLQDVDGNTALHHAVNDPCYLHEYTTEIFLALLGLQRNSFECQVRLSRACMVTYKHELLSLFRYGKGKSSYTTKNDFIPQKILKSSHTTQFMYKSFQLT